MQWLRTALTKQTTQGARSKRTWETAEPIKMYYLLRDASKLNMSLVLARRERDIRLQERSLPSQARSTTRR